jgi:hypothetical protein
MEIAAASRSKLASHPIAGHFVNVIVALWMPMNPRGP